MLFASGAYSETSFWSPRCLVLLASVAQSGTAADRIKPNLESGWKTAPARDSRFKWEI